MIRKASTARGEADRRGVKTHVAARRAVVRVRKKATGGDGKAARRGVKTRLTARKAVRMRKTSGGDGKAARRGAKPRAAAKKAEPTIAATGLPHAAVVSKARHCRYLPDASQFPSASLSGRLPSPAMATGQITLARLFGTRGANWPAEFRRTPFRPGRPKEVGLVSALAWLLSQPVLGGPRLVHRIAKGVRDAASKQKRSLAEELLALRMKLETGDITEAEFRRLKAQIDAAGKEPVEKKAKPPKKKRRKED